MKTFVRHAMTLLTAFAACQAGLAMAEDYYWVGSGDKPAASASDQKVAAPAQQACAACDPACASDSCDLGNACCERDPLLAINGFVGFDSFKGVSDFALQSNFGAVAGFNASVPLFSLAERGFGWQVGVSHGVYDWDGRVGLNDGSGQQQTFVTTGFFRKAAVGEKLSFGLVYDWMFNENWGVASTSPTLGQWRGQVEYAVSESNSFGLRGALRDNTAREGVEATFDDTEIAALISNRAISHAEFFWHHQFESKADSFLWIGGTQDDRLNEDESLCNIVLGASIEAPLSERLALYGAGEYLHPTSTAGVVGSVEEGFNVSAGIVWYFGCHAKDRSIHGTYGPYMPVANNSTFLVDQSIYVAP